MYSSLIQRGAALHSHFLTSFWFLSHCMHLKLSGTKESPPSLFMSQHLTSWQCLEPSFHVKWKKVNLFLPWVISLLIQDRKTLQFPHLLFCISWCENDSLYLRRNPGRWDEKKPSCVTQIILSVPWNAEANHTMKTQISLRCTEGSGWMIFK